MTGSRNFIGMPQYAKSLSQLDYVQFSMMILSSNDPGLTVGSFDLITVCIYGTCAWRNIYGIYRRIQLLEK